MSYVPQFMRKYEILQQFFTQLRDITNEQESLNQSVRQESRQDSVNECESLTSRPTPAKPRRVNYINKKRQPSIVREPVRPSDIILSEQNKKIIDQFCSDNAVLHEGIQDCMHVIEQMKRRIIELQHQQCIDYPGIIKQLEFKLKHYSDTIEQKNKVINEYRNKYDKIVKIIEEHSVEHEQEQAETDQYVTQLQTENVFLRKLLAISYSEEQLKAVELVQADADFNFYDNFCVSRRDLERQAIIEYEKILASRKGKIEQQFVDWHVSYMTNQQQKMQFQDQEPNMMEEDPDVDMYNEEKEMAIKKAKVLSKEEKNKIMEDLLKPIGKQAISITDQQQEQEQSTIQKQQQKQQNTNKQSQSQPVSQQQLSNQQQQQMLSLSQQQLLLQQDVKSYQLDILNQTPQKKDSKSKLAIDIGDDKQKQNQQVIELENYDEGDDDDEEIELPVGNSGNKQKPNEQKKTQKEIMNSLEEGWQKLMQIKQTKVQQARYDDQEEDDQVTYLPNGGGQQEHMFQNQKTIFYEQDYYEDDDDDEIYQQILEKQKQLASNKHSLSKTQKNQELQYQI